MSGTDAALLRAHFPTLADRLSDTDDGPPGFAIEKAATGEPTLRIAGALAHSSRDPRREARKIAEAYRGEGPLVVLGFGLGYVAEAAIDLDENRPLIIAESRPAALALAFRERDLSSLIVRKGTVFVVSGPSDGVLAALEAFGGEPRVVSNRAVRAQDEAWYDEVEKVVRTWVDKDRINAATLARFGKRWVRNLAVNLGAIRDYPGVALLSGSAAGLPALVVAAGPSLDEVLPALPAIARRCLIIAVDTALRAILTAGVEPDFVLVVDPQFWNARHLDRCPSSRTTLVTESAVYPSVLRPSCTDGYGRTFLCSSQYPLGRFVEDRVDSKGVLGAGGSVATTALDLTRVLGASPVWIAGLDLAFPDLKTHFKGALFEERSHGDARRFDPVELRSFRALRDGHPFSSDDASGGKVLTDKRLSFYAAWFESRFRNHRVERPRSLSRRGLRIAGLQLGSAKEILELGERREEIDERFGAIYSKVAGVFNGKDIRAERKTRYDAAIKELQKELVEIADLSQRAAAQCTAALSALEAERYASDHADAGNTVTAALGFLDTVNAALATSGVKEVVGFLFPPLASLEAELGLAGSDALKRHLGLSRLLYLRLGESADYHASVLRPAAKKG